MASEDLQMTNEELLDSLRLINNIMHEKGEGSLALSSGYGDNHFYFLKII